MSFPAPPPHARFEPAPPRPVVPIESLLTGEDVEILNKDNTPPIPVSSLTRTSLYAQGFKRVDVFLYGAILVAFLAGLFGGYNLNGQHLVKVKVPVATKVQIGGYADIVKALGKPDKELPGEQVNPQLKGLTCGVWESKPLVVCGA